MKKIQLNQMPGGYYFSVTRGNVKYHLYHSVKYNQFIVKSFMMNLKSEFAFRTRIVNSLQDAIQKYKVFKNLPEQYPEYF